MNVQMLYRFPVTAEKGKLPHAWFLLEKSNRLAVVYVSDKVRTDPCSCSLSFLLLDPHTGSVLKEVTVHYPLTDIEALHLAYDVATAVWVISFLEYHQMTRSFHLVVRLVREDEYGKLVLSEPIFDDQANDMAGIGPLYVLQADHSRARLLYQKADIDYSSTPEIRLQQLDLTTLQAELSIEYCAESVLICQQEDVTLLLALIPQSDEVLRENEKVFTTERDSWSFSISAYSKGLDTIHWVQNLALSLPVGKRHVLVHGSDLEWLGVNACMIAGPQLPQTGESTFVIGITMMDVFDDRGYGHTSEEVSRMDRKRVETLLCMDKQGEVVRTCADAIGLRVQLCQVQSTIVGVDLVEGHWRLWRWTPLKETTFGKVVQIDQSLLRAHVLVDATAKEQDAFWLVKESNEGIRIVKYGLSTLREIAPALMLKDIHLLFPQETWSALDWHVSVDLLFYQETMLLLGFDQQNRLTLYQVGL
jgi:hypothetical protein